LAPTPEALMRSRYAAYVLNLTDYLFQTWHPRTRPSQIEPTAAGVKWLGLTIKAASAVVPGSSDTADHATVTFLARSRHGGRAQRMHECSRFERDELGRWMYVDGVFLK
jgi:SEC-C motif-containing protein